MKQLIGFTVKYYTLWNYWEEPQYIMDAYGKYHQNGIKQHYEYIKNVSFDIEKVKKLHPGLKIDEALRGKTRSWHDYVKVELPNHIFWGGKYVGKLIDEILVSDFKYCEWAASNYNQVNEYLSTCPIYLEQKVQEQKRLDEQLKQVGLITEGQIITVEFTSNGYNASKDYTSCWANATYNSIGVNVMFNGVKPVRGMYPYLMPFVNGKCQKTKGKSFQVEVAEVFNTNVYKDTIVQQIRIK